MTKRILIMAGGTGGHIFPGLAVAERLTTLGWQVEWLGTAQRMEAQLVPKAGYPIHFLDITGLRGKSKATLLAAPYKLIKAVLAAKNIIQQVRPDLVLGMGGFAAGPGGLAAWLAGIPLIIHEQNALPGMTNKLLAKIAQRVLTGFDQCFAAQRQGQQKYQWVGNPLRQQLQPVTEQNHGTERLRLLVLGGSLGARPLNQALPQAFKALNGTEWSVRHQAGKGHAEAVTHAYALCKAELEWQVSEFIDDMASHYAWADLVICRAGALTVAELALMGVAAILVPLPHAVDDHQTLNANVLVDAGAAILLPQHRLESELTELLHKLQQRPQNLAQMRQAAKTVAKPNATEEVVNICQQLVEQAA